MSSKKIKLTEPNCKTEFAVIANFRRSLADSIANIVESCNDRGCHTHIEYHPIPSIHGTIEIINRLREIVFPGYFGQGKLDPVNMKYNMGQAVSTVFDLLAEQISNSIRHDCFRYDNPCSDCQEQGQQKALALLDAIPSIRKKLAGDVLATFESDPAAKSIDEIVFCYPGMLAITVYRIAHRLFELNVPLLPRTMAEYAHSATGIDIHPGAEIGDRFVIDHGTGIVIGETTVIGDNVRLYQGVTLGAHSLPKDAGKHLKGEKRHPTIDDDVIIYSSATILGGDTVIGARSIVGGNVWLTQSVPPDTKVILEAPKLVYN